MKKGTDMILVNDGLPSMLLMLDLEMTGVKPSKYDILQVAATKLRLNENYQYEEIDMFNKYIQTTAQPRAGFHKKFMSDVYAKANKSDDTLQTVTKDFETFLGSWKGKVTAVGDCVITDLRFLFEKNVIKDNDIIDDKQVEGTLHYEIWDLNMSGQIYNQLVGYKMKKKELPGYDHEGIHDALVDVRNQTIEMNTMLAFFFGLRDNK